MTLRQSSMQWAGQYGLYKKLLIDEEMRYADNELTTFFNEKDAGNMGRLHRALSDFNVLRGQGGNGLTPSSAQEQLATVNGLSTESRAEQRLSEVLGILYSNISDLNAIGGNHESRLREIAHLCPIDHGFAVHIARSALVKLDTVAFSYLSDCERASNADGSNWKDDPVSFEANDALFKVYPNPNDGNMFLKFELNEEETGQIRVYDVLGKMVFEQAVLPESSPMAITVDGLGSGLYLLTIRVNDQIRLSERLSIISR